MFNTLCSIFLELIFIVVKLYSIAALVFMLKSIFKGLWYIVNKLERLPCREPNLKVCTWHYWASVCKVTSEKHFTFQTQVLIAININRSFMVSVIQSVQSLLVAARVWAQWGQQDWTQSCRLTSAVVTVRNNWSSCSSAALPFLAVVSF